MKIWIQIALASLFLVMASFAQAQSASSVLVVANRNNANSMALADYYRQQRRIPAANVLLLNWSADDNATTCNLATYNTSIATPISQKIASLGKIDYIVLCRNLPYIISDTQGSVDSALTCGRTVRINNPYYLKTAPFSSATYRCYLVTRLDGWSWNDAYALVNRSMSARPGNNIILDQDPRKDSNSQYRACNLMMQGAANILLYYGFSVAFDNTNSFIGAKQPLSGYMSWGSNDGSFSRTTFQSLTFAPGAIAETLVSTSAQYLRFPGGGQSQIAQLIQQGVTGIKGYVAEPQVAATARADFLFRNYVANQRNLAESFYAASPYMGWRDVIIGDPLCAPYRPSSSTEVYSGATGVQSLTGR